MKYNTDYAFPVDIEWDREHLLQIYEQTKASGNLLTARIDIREHDYLRKLQLKYPWLSNYIDFFTALPGLGFPIHIDTVENDRRVVINFPLINADAAYTNWYVIDNPDAWFRLDKSAEDQGSSMYSSKGKFLNHNALTDPLVPVYSMKLTVPTVINTGEPHGVKNPTSKKRIIASWLLNYKDFAEAKQELLNDR